MLRLFPLLLSAATLLCQAEPAAPSPARDPAAEFFAKAGVVRFVITLDSANRQQLRDRPREYVTAAMECDGKTTWARAGIKLKGAAGSFRAIDDRPGFTVNLGKFVPAGERAQDLHGLTRFHLNNCAQDETLLHEWLGSELFTAAGYPAPRVAHAHVVLNGQDLGLYVLREGFDEQFLRRVFGHRHGNLYDGGFCQDIDAALEKDCGDGPDDHSDLDTLRKLCGTFDAERTTRFESALDVPALVEFSALEAMLGHWDGYCQKSNNYRLYCALPPERTRFLPHGMDQIFGDANASILHYPSGIAAATVHEKPAWRRLYRERLKALLPLFHPRKLLPRIEAKASVLQAALRQARADTVERHATAVRDLIERVEARYKNLEEQVKAAEPAPLQFRGTEPIALKQWLPAAESDHVTLTRKSFQGVPALHVVCTEAGEGARSAAFLTNVLLGRGRYQLAATARCDGIVGLPNEDGTLHGGVRIAIDDARSEKLYGHRRWTELTCDFEVDDYQRNVELRLELRALAGKAWFRADSLKLRRLAAK